MFDKNLTDLVRGIRNNKDNEVNCKNNSKISCILINENGNILLLAFSVGGVETVEKEREVSMTSFEKLYFLQRQTRS